MPDNNTQKKRVAKQPADHPKYADMIRAAIVALKERSGSSRQAIEKYIKANYKVGDKASHSIKAALKRGASTGHFIHTSGVGASGSFKVNKEEKQKKAAKVVQAKKNPAEKPAVQKPAKKANKPAVQKPAKTANKPAVKKVPAKGKSGVKAAQKAKESAPKKTSSAKKQTSSVPEKSPVKKPSAKNSKATKAANKKPAGKKVNKK